MLVVALKNWKNTIEIIKTDYLGQDVSKNGKIRASEISPFPKSNNTGKNCQNQFPQNSIN